MADCFTMPNAAELVEELKCFHTLLDDYAEADVPYARCELDCIVQAADAIEQLLAENTKLKELYDKLDWERVKLKAERDAAVADIPPACGYCKWFKQNWFSNGDFNGDCKCPRPCENVSGVNVQWEWRGIKEEEDATD